MNVIYLDNNATTRPDDGVVEAMRPYFNEYYGNASSVHRFGQLARKAIDDARASVAELIGARDSDLTFTGSGTESVNTAIRGLLAGRAPRRQIVTSAVEHSATQELCRQLAREGFEICTIDVDDKGRLDLEALTAAIGDQTALVTLMWANNETGVIFPIPSIGELCKKAGAPLHVDGTQAVGKIELDVAKSHVDAMSFAAHKFHGPKGVAALFARRGLRIRPLLIGGPQERGRRGGTENVPGIVGMGKAAELAKRHLPDMRRVANLRDRLEQGILQNIADTSVNGDVEHRVPNTSNISFAQLEAEAILLLLSERDVCASAGAACSSGSLEPSHVLKAMKIEPRRAHGAIRFSLSRMTTEEEVERALEILPAVIARLRKVMPVG
ncbi:MAG: cysteine desulfurase NifS [Tepidisphaeraceae bacterium]|jgi:cysteine desulfurase